MLKKLFISFALAAAACASGGDSDVVKLQHENYTLADINNNELIALYVKDTGDTEENFKKYKSELSKDATYQKYMNTLFRSFRVTNNLAVMDWQSALPILAQVVKQTSNPVAAYEGLEIFRLSDPLLNQTYSGNKSFVTDYVKPFVPLFSQVLKDKGFCRGYYTSIGYTFYYYPENERYDALKLNPNALEICRKQEQEQKIDKYRFTQFKELYYKVSYILEQRDANK